MFVFRLTRSRLVVRPSPGCLQSSLSFRNAPGYSLPIELEEIFTLRQTNVSVIHQLVDHEERRGVHMCSPLKIVI